MEGTFLTRAQLAERLGCDKRTIDRMRKAGCPWMSLAGGVRFDFEEVKAWMHAKAQG